MQVFTRPAEDAYPPFHCPVQLVQSPVASQLSRLYWYLAWNGVTPIFTQKTLLVGPFPNWLSIGLLSTSKPIR